MSLRDKVNSAYIALAGDRVNLLSKFGLIGGFYLALDDHLLIGEILMVVSAVPFGLTDLGLKTLQFYKRTEAHIKEHGNLDSRFAETLISGTENRRLIGYCQLQGMYLAAKRYDQLNVFYRAKKAVSRNIIPNF